MKKPNTTLDTECVGLQGHVYDIAWANTANKKGDIVLEKNYLVQEVFTNPKKMMGAFYASKLFTHYAPMLERGEITMRPWLEIIEELRQDMREHGTKILSAYNAGFDLRVIQQTHESLGHDGLALDLDGIDILDIWQFACETKLSQATYKKLARELGWVTPKKNIKTGAEFAFRFTSGDWAFIEDHTALSDTLIEVEILAACFATKKKIPYNIINAAPWRIVNNDH